MIIDDTRLAERGMPIDVLDEAVSAIALLYQLVASEADDATFFAALRRFAAAPDLAPLYPAPYDI